MHKHAHPTLLGLLLCLCIWTCEKEVFTSLGFVGVETFPSIISFDGNTTSIQLIGDIDQQDTDSTNNAVIEKGFLFSTRASEPDLSNHTFRFPIEREDVQSRFDTTLDISTFLEEGNFFYFRAYAINRDLTTTVNEPSIVLGNTLTFEFQSRVSIFFVQAVCNETNPNLPPSIRATGVVDEVASNITIVESGFVYNRTGNPILGTDDRFDCALDPGMSVHPFSERFNCEIESINLSNDLFFRAFIIQDRIDQDQNIQRETIYSSTFLFRTSDQVTDTDGDLKPNFCDTDDDNDGVLDVDDNNGETGNLFVDYSLNWDRCGDKDGDGCDDCLIGTDNQGPQADNVGTPDEDNNGICDLLGPDADGDGCLNEVDAAPLISSMDSDGDGVSDDCDIAPNNPNSCGSTDDDQCDDCISGTYNPMNDGPDFDMDGICDDDDPDDDNDSIPDVSDLDFDNDGCLNTFDQLPMTFSPDFDGDGVGNDCDQSPSDQFLCLDTDNDGCNDCSSGTFDPMNDGLDCDGDGVCNETDDDIDGDGMSNENDPDDDNDGIPDVDDPVINC